jgi:DNA-binding transcriptional MerR regulator
MKSSGQIRYQAQAFARLAGVSVRALHHYDRLGLLKPTGRTSAGYRLYGPEHFARLQQIVTLKFIGFTLREIKRLISGADLTTALRLQRASLEEKRRQLGRAIDAIAKAEKLPASRRGPDWRAFADIIQRIQMQTNNDWTKKYYSKTAQKALTERGKLWSPELQEKVSGDWRQLFDDIKAAIAKNVSPGSTEGQMLAARWDKLVEAFTGGHGGIRQGVKRVWANYQKLPAANQKNMQPFKDAMSPEVTSFYAAAKEARPGK